MIVIHKTQARAACYCLTGVQKAVVVREVHDSCPCVNYSCPRLLDAAMFNCCDGVSLIGCPGQPRSFRGVAGLENEPAVFGQVVVGGSQEADCFVIAQQCLERMTGHIDEVEAQRRTRSCPFP